MARPSDQALAASGQAPAGLDATRCDPSRTPATVQKNCAACGDLITVRLADHKRGWGKFCDKACAAAHKCGQRPRDVNGYHAKSSLWAAERCRHFAVEYAGEKPPTAPSIKAQIGKVKIKPIYHSPCECRECGAQINGPGLCQNCDDHLAGMELSEAGWDGHKGYFA